MKDMQKRIDKLERHSGAYSRPRTVEEMTNDELAVIVTGNPNAKASDLSLNDLKAVIDKYAAEHPDTDIIYAVDERTKELTERLMAGELPGAALSRFVMPSSASFILPSCKDDFLSPPGCMSGSIASSCPIFKLGKRRRRSNA